MPRAWLGWGLLFSTLPAMFMLTGALGPVGVILAWSLSPLGLLILLGAPQRAPGVRPALLAWGVAVLFTVLGMSLTIGTKAGPIASVGGDDTALGWMVWAFAFVPLLPVNVLLATTSLGAERSLARAGLWLTGLALLVAILIAIVQPSRTNGDYAEATSLLTLVVLVTYGLVIAALGAGRVAARKAKPAPA